MILRRPQFLSCESLCNGLDRAQSRPTLSPRCRPSRLPPRPGHSTQPRTAAALSCGRGLGPGHRRGAGAFALALPRPRCARCNQPPSGHLTALRGRGLPSAAGFPPSLAPPSPGSELALVPWHRMVRGQFCTHLSARPSVGPPRPQAPPGRRRCARASLRAGPRPFARCAALPGAEMHARTPACLREGPVIPQMTGRRGPELRSSAPSSDRAALPRDGHLSDPQTVGCPRCTRREETSSQRPRCGHTASGPRTRTLTPSFLPCGALGTVTSALSPSPPHAGFVAEMRPSGYNPRLLSSSWAPAPFGVLKIFFICF